MYRQCTSSNEARSGNNSCRGKGISIAYSECVSVALVKRRTKHMRRIILSPVALVLSNFSTFYHKWSILRKKFVNVKFVF